MELEDVLVLELVGSVLVEDDWRDVVELADVLVLELVGSTLVEVDDP